MSLTIDIRENLEANHILYEFFVVIKGLKVPFYIPEFDTVIIIFENKKVIEKLKADKQRFVLIKDSNSISEGLYLLDPSNDSSYLSKKGKKKILYDPVEL